MTNITENRIAELARATAETCHWLVVKVSKTDPAAVEVSAVGPDDSALDAFSDQITAVEPDFFERIEEDAVEDLYADGFFENKDVTIGLYRRHEAINPPQPTVTIIAPPAGSA